MKAAERALLGRWAAYLARLSTLAWAGARHSTRGNQLHRDGAVGQLDASDEAATAGVLDGSHPERVRLTMQTGELASDCSCGGRRCAHAVAAVVELQRRARLVHASQQTHDAVMGALRQRLQARSSDAEATPRILSDLQRLPLDAAVDLVALTWRQSQRPAMAEAEALAEVAARVVTATREQPEAAEAWLLRLVSALCVRKVVFTALPTVAEQALHDLLRVRDSVDQPASPATVDGLSEAVLQGPAQVSAAVAAALGRDMARWPGTLAAVGERLLAWRARHGSDLWRETTQPNGRDLLWQTAQDLRLAAGDLAGAVELALAWGPGRSTLLELQRMVGAAGRDADALALAGWYDPRGTLWQDGLLAAATGLWQGAAASADGGAPSPQEAAHRGGLQRLASYAYERNPSAVWAGWLQRAALPADWPRRRQTLVDHALSTGDAEWLVPWLAGQADASEALWSAVAAGPLRERTVRAALDALLPLDAGRALSGHALRLTALASQGSVPARTLAEGLTQLDAVAAQLGETGLAREFAQLLGRELGDHAAVAQAVQRALKA